MDDDEKRFPRINLWQFLAGIWRLIVRVSMWPMEYHRHNRDRKSSR
jgi:hypothetical protein